MPIFLVQHVWLQLRVLPRFLFCCLTDLNLFPSVPPSTDQEQIRTQKLSTRVFMVSLALSLAVLLLYTCTVTVIKTVTIKRPTLNRYTDLYQQQSQTLSCPCTKISTNYQTFIHINPTMHQVCTSAFLQDDWISQLASLALQSHWSDDFRFTGLFVFEALRTLCQSAATSVSDSLLQFYSTNYVSALITSADLLRFQSEASIQQFISSTANSYLSSLRLIRDTTQANSLLSAKWSNYALYVASGYPNVFGRPRGYDDNCSCDSSSSCVTQSPIYQNNSRSSVWYVPGFYTGCFVLEALRRSHLECLYNQTCLAQLLFHFDSTTPLSITALDSSATSHFQPNTTVEKMLERLMVDNWNWTITHDDYYRSCQPSECTYTIRTRNDAIYIVTTLVGLIGGLVTALLLAVPHLIWSIRRCCEPRTPLSGNSVLVWIIHLTHSVGSVIQVRPSIKIEFLYSISIQWANSFLR